MARRRKKATLVAIIGIKDEFKALALMLFIMASVGWLIAQWSLTVVPAVGSGEENVVKQVIVKDHSKVIALTFDNGPDPRTTPLILDLLSKYKAKATFFINGEQGERYPEVLRCTHDSGHELGNNCYESRDYTRTSMEKFTQSLVQTNDVISKITGKPVALFRPALGRYNKSMVIKVADMGMRAVMWSHGTNSNDAWSSIPWEQIAKRVNGNAVPGSIVLLHDGGGDRTNTVMALSKILSRLTADGYKFLTVSELLVLEAKPQ